jgi:hypothetical protein
MVKARGCRVLVGLLVDGFWVPCLFWGCFVGLGFLSFVFCLVSLCILLVY